MTCLSFCLVLASFSIGQLVYLFIYFFKCAIRDLSGSKNGARFYRECCCQNHYQTSLGSMYKHEFKVNVCRMLMTYSFSNQYFTDFPVQDVKLYCTHLSFILLVNIVNSLEFALITSFVSKKFSHFITKHFILCSYCKYQLLCDVFIVFIVVLSSILWCETLKWLAGFLWFCWPVAPSTPLPTSTCGCSSWLETTCTRRVGATCSFT